MGARKISDYKILTVKEVVAITKISKTKIYVLVRDQAIPFIRIGGNVRFDENDIVKWLNSLRG